MRVCGFFIFLLFSNFTLSQNADTLLLSRIECEALFLKQNLYLLAEKLNVSKAEAVHHQTSLWPNPMVSAEEMNFWDKKSQRQITLQIEQMIFTAGKRKKLLDLENVSIELAAQQFEELLRNLKSHLREQMTQLQYAQLNNAILQEQLLSFKQLTESYQRQVNQGNIAMNALIRLKAQALEIAQDAHEWQLLKNEVQSNIKSMLHLDKKTFLMIADDDFDNISETPSPLSIDELISMAKQQRPDLKLARLDEEYQQKLLHYEKSRRIPDLFLKGIYDKNGPTKENFFGVGIGMELPFFNRNQGNIRSAKIGIRQAEIYSRNLMQSAENELIKNYRNYLAAYAFRKNIEAGYVQTLNDMLSAYTKNFQLKNLSVVEYLDFVEAYLENRKSILDAGKSLRNAAEALNHSVGKDVIVQ